jgi:CRP-like cAMP-binding protein
MHCSCKLSSGRVIALPGQLRPRFLSGIAKEDLAAVLGLARHRQFRSGSIVINQEDPADRLFLLTSGRARQFVITTQGRKILLQWLTAGQIFGGAAILAIPFQYLACTEVLSDSCALVWERQTIRERMPEFPTLLDNVLSIAVTENIAWSTAAHVSLSTDDAHGRVANLLLSLASAIGQVTSEGVSMRVTNEDLAEGANVTVFTASRCVTQWQRAGILRKSRGTVVLKKPELLLAR